MTNGYGFLSVLPPLIAIVFAIRTKQVYISLLFGIWFSWLIINNWNVFTGTLEAINSLVDVFQDSGQTRTLLL